MTVEQLSIFDVVEVEHDIKDVVLQQLRLIADKGTPHEVGGLILINGDVVELPNLAPIEHQKHIYEADIEVRSDIAYFWHSHPTGPAAVSDMDKDMMSNMFRYLGFDQPWVIVCPSSITVWQINGTAAQ